MKKFLKGLLIVVVLLVAGALITAAFVDTHFHVKRSVVINKDKATVFDFIKHLDNQKQYSKWQEMDPNQTHNIRNRWSKGIHCSLGV